MPTVVPAVVDRVVAVAVAALPDWQVFDGPRAAEDVARDVLVIGVGNEEDADPYRAARGQWDLGNRPTQTITIRCQASTWSGDVDLPPLRDRLAGMVAAFDAALQADLQISDTCALINLGSERWYHVEREAAGVGLHFDLVIVAVA